VIDVDKRLKLQQQLKTLYTNRVILGSSGSSTNNSTATTNNDNNSSSSTHCCTQLVTFHDTYYNAAAGTLNLIVEYMNGGSLQDIVDTGGCDTEQVLASISYQVLLGLQHLHEHRRMHRDIKPANLLINHIGQVSVSSSYCCCNVMYMYVDSSLCSSVPY
jgi:serine/threonine protein kinase